MSRTAVSGTHKDEEGIPPVLSTPGPSIFLFVNETSDPPAYKHQKRPEIRAHIRNSVHKQSQSRKIHKPALKRTILPNYAPLKSRVLATKISKYLEHDRDCPSSVSLATRPRLSHRGCDSLSGAPRLVEIIKPVNGLTSHSTPDESLKPSELRGGLTTYCKACGLRLKIPKVEQRHPSKQWSLVPKNAKSRMPLKLNPTGTLGAGRTDPFSSLPMVKPSLYSQELMDHTVTYLLPGLIPDKAPPSDVNPLSKAYFSFGLQTPLVFHALVYAGSNHLDFLHSSDIFPNSPTPLSHKIIIIQKINEALANPSQALSDEVIFAILVLASQEVFMSKGTSSPFNSPLPNLQWLNIYGNFKFVPEHTKAIAEIITMRGGLENLKLYKLAEIIIGGDITSATNSVTKPGFPPLRVHTASIAALRAWAICPPRSPIQTQAAAFWRLQDYGIPDYMLQVLDSMGAYALAVISYLEGKPFSLGPGEMGRTRLAVQQTLLLLPTSEELSRIPWSSPKPNIYECCRLTALIFGVAVVYPIPNSYNVLLELVQRLKAAIELVGIVTFGIDLYGVLLWMLVLGGIAATDKPQRPWFVSQLALVTRKLDIIDWGGIEDILESFLWLESACGHGGRELWGEAAVASYSLPLRPLTI